MYVTTTVPSIYLLPIVSLVRRCLLGLSTGKSMHYFPKIKVRRRCKSSSKQPLQVSSRQNKYLKHVRRLAKTIPNWNDLFSEELSDEARMEQWIRLKIMGGPLISDYAWAVPDDKALNILRHFSPLVEMGAGKGYWSRYVSLCGCTVLLISLPSADADGSLLNVLCA